MTLLEEMESESWHILVSIYTHRRLVESLPRSETRYDLANQLVALNEMREMLIVRVARLADKRKDARSVSMLMKRGNFSAPSAQIAPAVARFLTLAEPVVKMRHEQVAHMKPGVLSSYQPRELPTAVLRATEALIDLVDVARGKPLTYTYRVGSVESVIDLKASLQAGALVAAKPTPPRGAA